MNARRFVLVAFLTLAVVAIVTTAVRKPDRKVAGPVTVVVPRRELRDSGPANQGTVATHSRKTTAAKKATRRSGSSTAGNRPPNRTVKSPTRTGTQKRRVSARKRKPARTKPDRPTSSQQPGTPTQTQPSQPAPEPPPAVSVPLPSVCTKPIHIGTCP